MGGDGFALEVNEGETSGDGFVLDLLLAGRDAWGDEDGTLAGGREQMLLLMDESCGLDVRNTRGIIVGILADGQAGCCAFLFGELGIAGVTVAEDLQLIGAFEQEEIAEGGIADSLDGDAERASHQVGVGTAE